jgi:hypothetical protein
LHFAAQTEGVRVLVSQYEPFKTRREAESAVQPKACQPAGKETLGEGAALELEVVVEEVVDGLIVVVGAGVLEEEEVVVAEEAEVEVEVTKASFLKMLILYPPPQTVPGSPPHLEVQPSVAGIKFACEPHQHSCPYSTPA